MVKAAFGKEPKDLPEKMQPLAEGIHGIFGKGDEREVQTLLATLEQEKGYKGSRARYTRFKKWAFPDSEDFWEKTTSFYLKNELSTFITGLGSPERFETSSRTRKVTSKLKDGAKATTTTTGKTYKSSVDNRLTFLKQMMDIIDSEETEEDGFKKLQDYLETHEIVAKRAILVDAVKMLVGTGRGVATSAHKKAEDFAEKLRERRQEREASPLAPARSLFRQIF